VGAVLPLSSPDGSVGAATALHQEEDIMRTTSRGLMVAAGATLALALSAEPALAHTDEPVGGGDLRLVIGFGAEPAYVGQPNSVQVHVFDGDEPVTDLRPGDLQADVSFGDASATIDLEPYAALGTGGEPGDYRAWFVPSQAGDYTFRIRGTVDGEEVDEEATSGPDTFSEVIDLAEASFPPIDAPTNDELATRIARDAERITDAVGAAEATAETAADAAASARTTALIAIAVGAIGVIAGIAGIAAARTARR